MLKVTNKKIRSILTSFLSLLSALKWIITYGKRAGIWILLAVSVAMIINGLTMPIQLWALGRIVDSWVVNRGFLYLFFVILPWIGLMITVRIIGSLTSAWGEMKRRQLEENMTLHIQTDLFNKTTDVEFSYFENEDYYNKLQRANDGMGGVFLGLMFQTFSVLESIVRLAGLSIIAIQGHWAIPLVLFAAGIPIFILQSKFSVERYNLAYDQTPQFRLMHYFVELLSNREAAKEIRLYGVSSYLVGRWRTLYEKLRLEILHQSIKQRLIVGLVESLHVVTFGVSLWLLILSLQSGQLSLGAFVTVIYAVLSMQSDWEWTIRWIGWIYDDYLRFVRDWLSFLSLPERTKQADEKFPLATNGLKIEMQNVSYTYPNTTHQVLKNINLAIQPGEKIALLGENGSGKSTLVKLISGLLQPTEGEIRVNGEVIQDTETLWNETSAVFQDFSQYHMSARENIGLGDSEKIDDIHHIREAAKKGGAADFIDTWEKEFVTMLGPTFGGNDLSGGQWQKIAISRGFMPIAQLFILDEPTAALDALAEKKVYERFQAMAGEQTAILISHRIGFASLADKIVVLKDSQLLEYGTHEELEALNGEYAKLLRIQSQWY